MKSQLRLGLFLLLFLFVLGNLALLAPAQEKKSRPVHIGMVRSVFRDVPAWQQRMMLVPFGGLMRSLTGINGQMFLVDDAMALGEKLEKDEMQLGVFHGFELAWAQEKYPKLKPLMIAVNRRRWLYANLVVRDDSNVSSFEQMKGKAVSLPKRSRGHCWLFMERSCESLGCAAGDHFTKIERHANIQDGLDEVVRGNVDGIIADAVSLECYKQVKPGCWRRLKTISSSPWFPAAVIAHREGRLDEATLKKFREGLLSASKNFHSKQLMTLAKLTAFEMIPEGYDQCLVDIRNEYPASRRELRKIKRKLKRDSKK